MHKTRALSLAEIEDLAPRALGRALSLTKDGLARQPCAARARAGASADNARPLAVATATTEADGIASHGLAYIPIYCEHVRCGKVDGQAQPVQPRRRWR